MGSPKTQVACYSPAAPMPFSFAMTMLWVRYGVVSGANVVLGVWLDSFMHADAPASRLTAVTRIAQFIAQHLCIASRRIASSRTVRSPVRAARAILSVPSVFRSEQY